LGEMRASTKVQSKHAKGNVYKKNRRARGRGATTKKKRSQE